MPGQAPSGPAGHRICDEEASPHRLQSLDLEPELQAGSVTYLIEYFHAFCEEVQS